MLCITHPETDPYFNLATEEHFMDSFGHGRSNSHDIFMLWRNAPAIIVGRHQNTLAEINLDYVRENDLPVVRRMSGGGAVFHDLGNLNFTFIADGGAGTHRTEVDFRRFTQPIIDALQGLGVDAHFEGRNDLTIDGRKFSGNAEYIHRSRILHHGTLLFSARMADIAAALRPDPAKFADKAVKSVRSRVTNISEHLQRPMTVLEFRDYLMAYVMTKTPGAEAYTFTADDRASIAHLRDTKYATWEWNFGHSPRYNFNKRARTPGGMIEVTLDVDEGVIQAAHFYGDYFTHGDPADLAAALIGAPHHKEALRKRLAAFHMPDYFHNISADDVLDVLI